MFTYKLVGLGPAESPTPYYYGSLPAKPEIGHILRFDTGRAYRVVRVEGKGLVGRTAKEDRENQRELAWAEINRDERVPTLRLEREHRPERIPATIEAFKRSDSVKPVRKPTESASPLTGATGSRQIVRV